MKLEPNKYDALTTSVRIAANAELALVVVLGGGQGNGYGLKLREGTELSPKALCKVLRQLAAQIEESEP